MAEETMIHDFSTAILGSVRGLTAGVFLDVQECPFLKDVDPCFIYRSLKNSLVELGYKGDMTIYAYSEKTFSDDELMKYLNAKIIFLPQVPGDKIERVHRMIHDMFLWASDIGKRPAHLMVIANNIPGEDDICLVNCLENLRPLGYNAFLVQPAKFLSESSDWESFLSFIGEAFTSNLLKTANQP